MPKTRLQIQLESNMGEVLAATPKGTEWGVAVIDATTLRIIAGINGDMKTEALSLSKVALAHVVTRQIALGLKNPSDPLPIHDLDIRPGGFLPHTQSQLIPTLQDVLRATLLVSDTTGQRALTRELKGPEIVNNLLYARAPQSSDGSSQPLIVTRLQPVMGETGPTARFFTGETTPFEAALFTAAATNDPTVSEAMRLNIFGYGARRELPGSTGPSPDYLALLARAADPEQTVSRGELTALMHPDWKPSRYAGMMGIDGEDGLWHDAMRVGNTVLVAMAQGYPELPENPQHPALDTHARLGKLVFGYAQNA